MTVAGPARGVRFDQDAAEDAARELLVTAESLIEALSVLDASREVTVEDWEGRFRTTFDHEISTVAAGATFLVDMLQQMAAVIRARSWQAAAAQAAYEQAQEDE